MGSVKVQDWSIELGFLNARTGKLTGTRRTDHEARDYGLPEDDELGSPVPDEAPSGGLFRTIVYKEEADVKRLEEALIAGPLRAYLGRQ
jgi:hypothetical protein